MATNGPQYSDFLLESRCEAKCLSWPLRLSCFSLSSESLKQFCCRVDKFAAVQKTRKQRARWKLHARSSGATWGGNADIGDLTLYIHLSPFLPFAGRRHWSQNARPHTVPHSQRVRRSKWSLVPTTAHRWKALITQNTIPHRSVEMPEIRNFSGLQGLQFWGWR